MAGNLSNEAENKILEHSTGKTAWSKPTVYLALFTSAPTDSTTGTEVSGGGYNRVIVSDGTNSVFGAAGSGQITNNGTYNNSTGSNTTLTSSGTGVISFAPASASWGVVTSVALVSSASAALTTSDIIWYGTLTSSKTVDSGDTFQFAASSLTLSLD